MNKATIFTTDGNEIEAEYEWIRETDTTITFGLTDSCYTSFSKFNTIMWAIDEQNAR